MTLADFSVAAPLFYAKEAELPVAPYPTLRDWSARVLALPAWRDTAPQRPALPAAAVSDLVRSRSDTSETGHVVKRAEPLDLMRYNLRAPTGRAQRVGTGFSPR